MTEPIDILRDYWGYPAFRPLQEDIIRSVLQKQDTLALFPTGGGKSICYQVPALMMDGLCLVISPLIALMKDQVAGLRKRNITAYAIYAGMTRPEIINTLIVAGQSNCKFLYVSPERLETNLFKEYLPGLGVSMIAVDEAHCISQWGYDFRPVYLRIAGLRKELPDVPVLALTASATPDVQQDIMDKLARDADETGLPAHPDAVPDLSSRYKDWFIYRQHFARTNLSYSCFLAESKMNKILEILGKVPGTAIVYARTRRNCRELSDLLKLHGLSADYYHAGLTREERDQRQEDWIQNRTRVMVCTNAFGMGIDKADVRVVIHADTPDCLENYYQEAGRAGRDGKKSFAVLLYQPKDIDVLQEQAEQKFPGVTDIRHLYQSLANYLHIPAGEGSGESYAFDLTDFVQKFNLPLHLALNGLKMLEQEGWLAFNEEVFIPAKVGFTCSKDFLYTFEKEQPVYDPIVKALLRTYEGIFDQPVPITEKQLAWLLKTDESSIRKQLTDLAAWRLLDYFPQSDSPRITFLRNRIRTEDLTINEKALQARRERYERRLRAFIQYLENKTRCRSKQLAAYFGETIEKDCGVCDNCLQQKRSKISREEFENIRSRMEELLKPEPLLPEELLNGLRIFSKEKVWQVIEFLQAEEKIETGKDGRISFK